MTLMIVLSTLLVSSGGSYLPDYCISEADPYTNYGIDLDTTKVQGDELRFLAIGDWGNLDCSDPTCDPNLARKIAATMGDYATTFNPSFIISVGDHFYPDGIQSVTHSRWHTSFENLFDAESLKHLYWYGTLGNNDYDQNVYNYETNLPSQTWDNGTNCQIYYTTHVANIYKRWCLPSYYYTFSYQFADKTIRFISIDTVTLINDCVKHSTNPFCQGNSVPNLSDFWVWFHKTVRTSKQKDDITIVFTHYELVSNGNHGINNSENVKCEGITASNSVLQNISKILIHYEIPLYICGHEHLSGLFNGTSRYEMNNDNDYELIELLPASTGRTNCNTCGGQKDINKEFKDFPIVWNMIYGSLELAFGAVVINNTHFDVSLIGENGQILGSTSMQWNKGNYNSVVTAIATFESWECGVDGTVTVDDNGNVFINLNVSNLDTSACDLDGNGNIVLEYGIYSKCTSDTIGDFYNPFNAPKCSESNLNGNKYFGCAIGDWSGRFGDAVIDNNNKIVIEGNISEEDNDIESGFCLSRLTPQRLHHRSIAFVCKDEKATTLFCAPFKVVKMKQ